MTNIDCKRPENEIELIGSSGRAPSANVGKHRSRNMKQKDSIARRETRSSQSHKGGKKKARKTTT